MSQNSNGNSAIVTEDLKDLPNFENVENVIQALTKPMAKELFMAHLGLSKLTSTSDSQSNSSNYIKSSAQLPRISGEEKSNPYGIHRHVSELVNLASLFSQNNRPVSVAYCEGVATNRGIGQGA